MPKYDAAYLYNPSDEAVKDAWNGEPYSISAKEIKPMPRFLVDHFINHDQAKKDKVGLMLLELVDVEVTKIGAKPAKVEEAPAKKQGRPKKEVQAFADLA